MADKTLRPALIAAAESIFGDKFEFACGNIFVTEIGEMVQHAENDYIFTGK